MLSLEDEDRCPEAGWFYCIQGQGPKSPGELRCGATITNEAVAAWTPPHLALAADQQVDL